jgi:LMBR1-like membrane protein
LEGSAGCSLPEHDETWRYVTIPGPYTDSICRFILPILAEYSDAGYRDPIGRFKYSLRSNAQYQAIVFGSGILGLIYFFVQYGVKFDSLKGVLMALAYCWGLVLAIYLMGHGLVAVPRKLFRNASISGRLRRIQAHAPKVHEKMDDAIHKLEDLEAQVAELSHRKTGSAVSFREWIEELAEASNLPESRPRTLSRRLSAPTINVPIVITERYMADLSRQLNRARHARVRWIDEWDRLLQDASTTQSILDSAASKMLEIGQSSPTASYLERLTIFTPYTRYIYYAHIVPYTRILLGCLVSLASICIIWSEIIKYAAPKLSIISLTVVHHPTSGRGKIGFTGQVIASAWIMYMCTAALTSVTEVRVWRGRALVRRNTAYESAFWYAMQVAKLSIPLAYNFMTFLSQSVYGKTTFYDFLGRLIDLTPLGKWFDILFPIFILVPVCATLFNLYGRVKRLLGFGIIDDDEENETGFGTGSWREGRDLIERELSGHSGLGHLRDGASATPLPSSHAHTQPPTTPSSTSDPATHTSNTSRPRAPAAPAAPLPPSQEPEEENFFEALAHRARNTLDTVQKPKWMQGSGDGGGGFKRPKWLGGGEPDDGSGAGSSASARPSAGGRSGSSLLNLFGGRGNDEGRLRL